MEKINSQDIERLLSLSHGDFTATDICRMAGAGSDRRYYRIDSRNGLLAGTCGDDLPENRAFVYLSGHFAEKGIPVPRVLAHTPGFEAYIQTYAGDESVFERLACSRESRHYTPSDRLILENCMRILSRLQHQGAESLDFSRCYPDASLSPRLVLWDLNYFKYCFLKPSGIGFDENKLQDDFDALAAEILVGKGLGSLIGVTSVTPLPYAAAEQCVMPEIFGSYAGSYMQSRIAQPGTIRRLVPEPGAEEVTGFADHDLKHLYPAVIRFRNRLGGRIAVLPYEIRETADNVAVYHLICHQRQKMFHALTDWMDPTLLPCRFPDGSEIVIQYWREVKHSILVLTNIAYDVYDSYELESPCLWIMRNVSRTTVPSVR